MRLKKDSEECDGRLMTPSRDDAIRMRDAGVVRQPYFPPRDYVHIAEGLEEVLTQLPEAPEGHISPQQAEFLYHFIRLIQPAFIVETGLCVGHAACVAMLAQRSIGIEPRLLSVDICQYEQTRLAMPLLSGKFEHFSFVEGDSKEVLAGAVDKYLRQNEGLTLDLGIIDGGHDAETVGHDLNTLLAFLSLGGFLWLDDFEKQVPNFGVNMAGREFANKWGSCHRFRAPGNRGIMLYQKAF